MRFFLRTGIPFVVENPAMSMLWLLPAIVAIAKHSAVTVVYADQCLFGTPWRKRTALLCGSIDPEDLKELACRCRSTGGICQRSNKRHQHFIGSDKHGQSWASRAQTYPSALAKMLGTVLDHASVATSL